MSGDTVRASRSLYRAALADAIDWTETLIQAGHPQADDIARLARYRKALAAIGGQRAEPDTRPVTLSEVRPNDEIKFPPAPHGGGS